MFHPRTCSLFGRRMIVADVDGDTSNDVVVLQCDTKVLWYRNLLSGRDFANGRTILDINVHAGRVVGSRQVRSFSGEWWCEMPYNSAHGCAPYRSPSVSKYNGRNTLDKNVHARRIVGSPHVCNLRSFSDFSRETDSAKYSIIMRMSKIALYFFLIGHILRGISLL